MKKINSLQYGSFIWFILRSCFLELTLTSILYLVKEDAWIAVIIGVLIGLIPFFMFEYIKNKSPKDNFITLNEKLFKHPNIINITLLIGIFMINISSFWILLRFANSLFLYKTNLWIISLVLIVPIFYAAYKGIHVIAKVGQILFFVSIILNIIIMIGLTGEININNINPIFQSSPNKTALSAILFTFLNLSKLFFLTIIPKEKIINYDSKKNLIFYIIATINMIQITISIICIFGIDLTLLYEYPAFQILKRVNLLGVIDRIESILSTEALLSTFIELSIITYYLTELLKSIFKSKKTNRFLISIYLITFLVSNIIFQNHEDGEKFITNKMIYVFLFTCILIPLIILIKLIKKSRVIK